VAGTRVNHWRPALPPASRIGYGSQPPAGEEKKTTQSGVALATVRRAMIALIL